MQLAYNPGRGKVSYEGTVTEKITLLLIDDTTVHSSSEKSIERKTATSDCQLINHYVRALGPDQKRMKN